MYCSVMADLSRYERECDQREKEWERERQEKIWQLGMDLVDKPDTKLEFYGDVRSLFMEVACSNDEVANVMVAALQNLAWQGDAKAMCAVDQIKNHYIEVML